MNSQDQIHYLTRQQIDLLKWDNCIRQAPNGLIYAYSFYLDTMAKNWDALVLNDYEAVMPLSWNRKYGFSYLYQPAFTASLGVFGKNLSRSLISDFIKAIPRKFKLTEIPLNTGNLFENLPPGSYTRSNYVLNLNKPYQQLAVAFRENHQRNINKALQAGCTIRKDIPVNLVVDLNHEQLKTINPVKKEDYRNFINLYSFLQKENKAETYAALDNNQQLVASCVFFYSHSRAYYILVGNTKKGKSMGASHALIDAYIREKAEKEMLLDFEGSDIESLAFFYAGFGAKEEFYPALKTNNLPWLIRWLKN